MQITIYNKYGKKGKQNQSKSTSSTCYMLTTATTTTTKTAIIFVMIKLLLHIVPVSHNLNCANKAQQHQWNEIKCIKERVYVCFCLHSFIIFHGR